MENFRLNLKKDSETPFLIILYGIFFLNSILKIKYSIMALFFDKTFLAKVLEILFFY